MSIVKNGKQSHGTDVNTLDFWWVGGWQVCAAPLNHFACLYIALFLFQMMHQNVLLKSLPEIALLSLSCKRHLCLLTFNLGLRLLCIEWHTQFSFMRHFVAWPKDIFLFWYLVVLVLSFFFFYLVLHLVACPDAKISFCFRPFSVCRKDYSILSDSHKDDQQQKCLHKSQSKSNHKSNHKSQFTQRWSSTKMSAPFCKSNNALHGLFVLGRPRMNYK